MKAIGQQAEEIVDGILQDMSDCGGLQNVWDEIDAETQGEIRAKWMLIARRVIETAS